MDAPHEATGGTSAAAGTTGGADHVDHLLAQWTVERPDLDTSALRIAARLVRLGRYLDRATADHLAPWELTEGEQNVLAALRRSGAPYELTPTELYRSLLVSSGAMTNRLDRLEAAGLIVRTPDPRDRRRTQVGLTERGREVIDAALDAHIRELRHFFDGLDAAQADQLTDLLRRVLRHLEASDPDA